MAHDDAFRVLSYSQVGSVVEGGHCFVGDHPWCWLYWVSLDADRQHGSRCAACIRMGRRCTVAYGASHRMHGSALSELRCSLDLDRNEGAGGQQLG